MKVNTVYRKGGYMSKLKYIIIGILILIVAYSINISNQDTNTGIMINDYSYGIGRDDETGMTKVDFSIYVHNNTTNTVVVDSVKPIMEDRLSDLIFGDDKIDIGSIVLELDTGKSFDGVILFDHDGDKSFWVQEDQGLVLSFVVDAEVIVERIKF